MCLTRVTDNPILSPDPRHEWESEVVCNPGAWYENGRFYLLYRAAGRDTEHRIYFGLAVSEDGIHFSRVSDSPCFSPLEGNYDGGCVEDPRVVKIDDVFYITYAFRPFPPGRYWEKKDPPPQNPYSQTTAPQFLKENKANSALAISRDMQHFVRLGRFTAPELDDRDAVLFPEKIRNRYVLLHRPKEWVGSEYGCQYPSIWISFSDNILRWDKSRLLFYGREPWERKIGASAPPIRIPEGWFMLYHAVDEKGIYRVGAALLDAEDPSRVLARSRHPLLEPSLPCETDGLYKGCVFPTGNVLVDQTLFVYYGAGDQYCCAATANIRDLLACLEKESR